MCWCVYILDVLASIGMSTLVGNRCNELLRDSHLPSTISCQHSLRRRTSPGWHDGSIMWQVDASSHQPRASLTRYTISSFCWPQTHIKCLFCFARGVIGVVTSLGRTCFILISQASQPHLGWWRHAGFRFGITGYPFMSWGCFRCNVIECFRLT